MGLEAQTDICARGAFRVKEIPMRGLATIVFYLAFAPLSPALMAQDAPPEKRGIGQFLAPACQRIADHANNFPAQQIQLATQYYTPLFRPGPDGKLRPEDRRSCLNVEGACLVGDYLYDTANRSGIQRSTVPYKFGPGSGKGPYNTTKALDPCRTLAADRHLYPMGTVIFIPEMRNKICPQSGKPVDGCFIVGDVGSAIQGGQRFDIFTGECSNYNKRTNTCGDQANAAFVAPRNTTFYVIQRDDPSPFNSGRKWMHS
jgi:3D (Asp-Asp-Asp) domain-containing protein